MSISNNAQILVEGGQSLVAYVAMTTSDNTVFKSAAAVWSGKSGYEPIIRPNGVVTGLNLVTAAVSGTNDKVDVAAFTAYSMGVLRSVGAAADTTITRGATANIGKISSITMTSVGAVAVVAGTDSADSTINETRGGAGGPPLIPVDSVEIAQIRFSGTGAGTAAVISASQIYQVVGTHTERSDYPAILEVNNIGEGSNAATAGKVNAFIEFSEALPAIHTGPIAKKTWIQYYTPSYTALGKAMDFKPVEKSHSVSSSQFYGGSVAGQSESIGQGGFTAILSDGIGDQLVAQKDQVLTVKFFQDRNKPPYVLTQGRLGVAREFPVADQVKGTVTISAETVSAEFLS